MDLMGTPKPETERTSSVDLPISTVSRESVDGWIRHQLCISYRALPVHVRRFCFVCASVSNQHWISWNHPAKRVIKPSQVPTRAQAAVASKSRHSILIDAIMACHHVIKLLLMFPQKSSMLHQSRPCPMCSMCGFQGMHIRDI